MIYASTDVIHVNQGGIFTFKNSTVEADAYTSKEIIAIWVWDIKQKRDSCT